VLLNREAERMFGYSADCLLGKPLDHLLPLRARATHGLQMDRFTFCGINGGKAHTRLALNGLRANGEEFLINASVSRVTVKGEVFLAIILREVNAPADFAGEPVVASRDRRKQTLIVGPTDRRKRAVTTHQANEREKRRLSKELYDDLGQRLSVLKLDLDWLENRHPDHDQSYPARIAQMQLLLDHIIMQTKDIASTLRPPLLDDFGLMPALKWITEVFQKRTAIACSIQSSGMANKAGDPVDSAVFRVVQESLRNIERHSQASHVHIILRRSDRCLEVVIQDDGIGMETGSENKPGCYGLITMQEHIYILSGTMTISNIVPKGMAIRATIPVEPILHSAARS
jgi:PAS domain S-box-containing protein